MHLSRGVLPLAGRTAVLRVHRLPSEQLLNRPRLMVTPLWPIASAGRDFVIAEPSRIPLGSQASTAGSRKLLYVDDNFLEDLCRNRFPGGKGGGPRQLLMTVIAIDPT